MFFFIITIKLSKTKTQNYSNVKNKNFGLPYMFLWGPTIRGSGPFAPGESESPIRGELWLKLYNAEHKTIFGEQPRTV